MDVRTEEEKQLCSWTNALRQIIINCYKYHEREDLLNWHMDQLEPKVEITTNLTIPEQNETENIDIQNLNATVEGVFNVDQLPENINQLYVLNPDGTTSVLPVKVVHINKENGVVSLVSAELSDKTDADQNIINIMLNDGSQMLQNSSQINEITQEVSQIQTDEDLQQLTVFRLVNIQNENDILSKSLNDIKAELNVEVE